MKKLLVFFLLALSVAEGFFPSPVSAQIPSFKFIAWGDTKSDINVLKNLSIQAKTLNPQFTIYAGDLESSGFTQSGMDTWKNALNGGTNNGIFNITFPVRGNHDSTDPSGWQNYFNLSSTAQSVYASNYSYLDDD